jgi:hypothetical protein
MAITPGTESLETAEAFLLVINRGKLTMVEYDSSPSAVVPGRVLLETPFHVFQEIVGEPDRWTKSVV